MKTHKALDRDVANDLADELLANEPRLCDSNILRLVSCLAELLRAQPTQSPDAPNPFVSPASPKWGILQRERSPLKCGR